MSFNRDWLWGGQAQEPGLKGSTVRQRGIFSSALTFNDKKWLTNVLSFRTIKWPQPTQRTVHCANADFWGNGLFSCKATKKPKCQRHRTSAYNSPCISVADKALHRTDKNEVFLHNKKVAINKWDWKREVKKKNHSCFPTLISWTPKVIRLSKNRNFYCLQVYIRTGCAEHMLHLKNKICEAIWVKFYSLGKQEGGMLCRYN